MGFWCVAEERIVKLFFPADSKEDKKQLIMHRMPKNADVRRRMEIAQFPLPADARMRFGINYFFLRES